MIDPKLIHLIQDNLIMVDLKTSLPWIQEQLQLRREEFCHSFTFSDSLLNHYCYNGFLPMSMCIGGIDVLSLKLHEKRVLLSPGDIKIKQNILNKFSECSITIDHDFTACVSAINNKYPDSWLSEPLVELFIHAHKKKGKVQLHSVELWRNNTLIAGEIGYSVGASYTSLSGFHTENSSGSAQLFALGKILELSGFKLWDMGMYGEYKIHLGGIVYAREDFLGILRSVRDDTAQLVPKEYRVDALFVKDTSKVS